jgi:hypothetical protein
MNGPMSWSQPVDLYCERTDPSLWAEPLNALSNAAFLIAAALALVRWRESERDLLVLALIGVVALIGAGSFAFHTLATRGAALLDVIPIAVFVYGYLGFALVRFLAMRRLAAFAILAGFVLASQAFSGALPRGFLNGSGHYLPALAAMLAIGLVPRAGRVRRHILAAASVFAVSLTLRTADLWACDALPVGTHFVWHLLNAAVLYILLSAALVPRSGGLSFSAAIDPGSRHTYTTGARSP